MITENNILEISNLIKHKYSLYYQYKQSDFRCYTIEIYNKGEVIITIFYNHGYLNYVFYD